jgi:hypothetical protein
VACGTWPVGACAESSLFKGKVVGRVADDERHQCLDRCCGFCGETFGHGFLGAAGIAEIEVVESAAEGADRSPDCRRCIDQLKQA